jgi:hypothetical protein
MPIGKYRIEGSQLEIKCEMLDLPYTMPGETLHGTQYLSVVEDDDHKVHVNFYDAMDAPESWGSYLAEVARVMARDYAECYFQTTEQEVLAGMCAGFNRNVNDEYLVREPAHTDGAEGSEEA